MLQILFEVTHAVETGTTTNREGDTTEEAEVRKRLTREVREIKRRGGIVDTPSSTL
jgi:hypothetical protein